ncbi:MAG: hypothetical protein JRD93_00205 [Deltaproteobacteria bacterium]|nr:hypothetical protein [Deltaproteobacteria bacterium]MBW2660428.1 hypothetical protein [Deltaproteobacteria bacterium]
MEITPHDISRIANDQKTNKIAKTTGNKFEDILQQTINKSSSSENQIMMLPPVQNISNIRFDIISNIDKAQNIERVEKFLDVLENYQKKLEDPSVKLKEMHPFVANMKNQADNMLPLLNSLPDEDGIKDILNRALVTSTVEAIKFNKGDYI